jgi:hypothetical protein
VVKRERNEGAGVTIRDQTDIGFLLRVVQCLSVSPCQINVLPSAGHCDTIPYRTETRIGSVDPFIFPRHSSLRQECHQQEHQQEYGGDKDEVPTATVLGLSSPCCCLCRHGLSAMSWPSRHLPNLRGNAFLYQNQHNQRNNNKCHKTKYYKIGSPSSVTCKIHNSTRRRGRIRPCWWNTVATSTRTIVKRRMGVVDQAR